MVYEVWGVFAEEGYSSGFYDVTSIGPSPKNPYGIVSYSVREEHQTLLNHDFLQLQQNNA